MEPFKRYLQKFPGFSEEAYREVLPHLRQETFKSGEHLLREGVTCRKVAFIEKGLLRIYYLNEGKEVTSCFCKEDTVSCSYKSLITQTPSDMAIEAIEDSKLLILSYDSIQKLFTKGLFWQQMGRIIAENEFITSECHSRFVNDLSAKERYNKILTEDKELLQRVPLNYLATYMQITPETLSRIRANIT